jgi:hypothetical protein
LELAAASVTDAIAHSRHAGQGTPERDTGELTGPRTEDSGLPSTLQIGPTKCKKTNPASSIRKALMRSFH